MKYSKLYHNKLKINSTWFMVGCGILNGKVKKQINNLY